MSGVDIAGLVERLVRDGCLFADRKAAADLIVAQAAELAEAREKAETAIEDAKMAVLSMLWMPGVRAALDNLPEGDPIETYLEMARKGD